MWDWISSSLLYNMAKDTIARALPNRRRITHEERMARREKWRPLFAEELHRCRTEKLRQDVIIHDVARPNEYPEAKDTKRRMSSWVRLGLGAQYHKGIEVALSVNALVWEESEESWRLLGIGEAAEETKTAYLIGYIPYESIVSVNFEGDEYYTFPHIFCHFEFRGQPYERLAFCERIVPPHGRPFFTEIESVEQVKLTSQKMGTGWMWHDG